MLRYWPRPLPHYLYVLTAPALVAAAFIAARLPALGDTVALLLMFAAVAGCAWLIVTVRDVGSRREAEAAMRRSSEIMQAVINSAPVAIVAVDSNGIVTTWNPAAERTFGWKASEVLGRPYVLADSATDPTFADSLAAALDGRATTFRAKRKRRDGAPLDVIVSTAPVLDSGGKLERVIALLTDTTEQTRLEAELRQVQKMEAIGRLAGGVAHDFNNLLTAILGFSEIALEELPPSSTGRAEIEEIKRAAERGAGLTHQLLAFSRKQILQPRMVDVNAQVALDERFLARIIGEDVRIVLNASPEPAFVRVDPAQLDQVIMNLAVNARDAMPSGGTLEIEVRRVRMDEGQRRHGVEMKPGDYVRIAITDNGHGMTPEVQQRLFEPFFTTKSPGKGTGLGLATVFGIVKQSGGYIWVYSEPGVGTSVKVYLPATEACAVSPRAGEAVEKDSAARPGTSTILVVDDEAAVAELTRRVLVRAGYEVLVASGPSDAARLSAAHAGTIDLLITDVVMPEAGGASVASALRQLHPAIRVLYMSGYTQGDVIRQTVTDPSAHFIEKPFAAETLARTVREVLSAA